MLVTKLQNKFPDLHIEEGFIPKVSLYVRGHNKKRNKYIGISLSNFTTPETEEQLYKSHCKEITTAFNL